MMILYHGTKEEFANNIITCGIDVHYGREKCDFGLGFYTTPNIELANEWALQRGYLTKPSIISVKIKDINQLRDLSVKRFSEINLNSSDEEKLEWGQFIVSNRCGREYVQELFIDEHNIDGRYDIVIGPIADGNIGLVARKCLCEKRKVTVQEVNNLLEKDMGLQYCFCTNESLYALETEPRKKGVVLR